MIRTHSEFQERKALDERRAAIINNIVILLTDNDMQRLHNMIQQIVSEHEKLTSTDGFYHHGSTYTNKSGIPYTTLTKVPIHPSLKDRMYEYIQQKKELEDDRIKLAQSLSVLIRSCKTDQSVRDALPEILIPFTNFKHLPRQNPEKYTLTSKLHIQQYEKTLDRIFFYLGSRLLG